MIVSSYTDAMTLEELKDDWPWVKRQASNLGKKTADEDAQKSNRPQSG